MNEAGWNRWLLCALVLAASAAWAGGAAARPPGHGRGGPPPGAFLEHLGDELELDAETRLAIQELIESSHAEAKALHERHRAARRAMRDLLAADHPDEAAVMAQAEALGEIETAKHKHRLATLLAIRKLLTPEQRAELARIQEEEKPRHPFGLVMEACAAEVESLCGDASGPFGISRCLRERRENVSEGCGKTLDELAEHRHHRLRGPHPFGRPDF